MVAVFPQIDCAHCKLSGVCLAKGLPENDMKELERVVQRKRPVRENRILFRQADFSTSLFVVKSGSFRGFIRERDGEEQTIGFYLPGDLLGLDALQKSDRHHCSVEALETSSVCELPRPQWEHLCLTSPAIRLQFLRMIGEHIVADQNNRVLLGNRTAIEKVAAFLLALSGRYHALGYSRKEFNLSMPRHDIANYLGLSLETLSRQLSQLIKAGAISVKHRDICIKDIHLLTELVEPGSSKRFSRVS